MNSFFDFLHVVPFLRLFICLALGICANRVGVDWRFASIFFTCSLVLFFLHIRYSKNTAAYRTRWMFGAAVFSFLFALGLLLCQFSFPSHLKPSFRANKPCLIEVLKPIKQGEKSVRVTAKVSSFSLESKQVFKVLVYFPKDSVSLQLLPGDRVAGYLSMMESDSLVPNPYSYSQSQILTSEGASCAAYVNQQSWQKLEDGHVFSLYRLSAESQNYLFSLLQRNLSDNELSVVSALVLGKKDILDSELRQDYSVAGVSHVLAVSGLHVGVIFLVLNGLFALFYPGNITPRPVVRCCVLITFLIGYAFITGLSASVVRSTLMFSAIQIGLALKRQHSVYNALAVSAFLMTLFSPSVLFDVGFWLSFSAVLSIVFFTPYIYSIIKSDNKIINNVWGTIAVTMSAQIGTIPISLFIFHQFSLSLGLIGLLVVPLSAVVIYMTLTYLLLIWIPGVPVLLGLLITWIVKVMNVLVQWTSTLKFCSLTNVYFDGYLFVCSVLIIVLLMFYLEMHRTILVWTIAFLLGMFLVWENVSFYRASQYSNFCVYNYRGKSVVNTFSVNHNILYEREQSDKILSDMTTFWSYNFTPSPMIDSMDMIGKLGDRKFFILSSDVMRDEQLSTPLNVYYVVVSSNAQYNSEEFAKMFRCKQLIVDSSNSPFSCQSWKNLSACLHIPVWVVSEKGAFIDKY